MKTIADPGAARPRAREDLYERNFFLTSVLVIWAATAIGFGLEMKERFTQGTLHYPLVVHAHAVVFVGWLMLITVQVLLIRTGHDRLHRRLGIVAVVLIPLMIVLAIATVIVSKRIQYGHPGTTFPFMGTQFTNVLASSVLFIAGLYLRRVAPSHKRLMLMGTIVLSEPGFRRIVGYLLDHHFHEGLLPYLFETYGGSLLLMVALGVYDICRQGRLYPAYVVAFVWCFANQLAATWLYYQPWWADLTTHLVGH